MKRAEKVSNVDALSSDFRTATVARRNSSWSTPTCSSFSARFIARRLYAAVTARADAGSIRTPGPIVVETATLWM